MKGTLTMSKPFGRELGLVHQIIMNARRHGANEAFWNALVRSDELMARVVDCVAFQSPTVRIEFRSADGSSYQISLLCCSETIEVRQMEVELRVSRFGRFATDDEVQSLCTELQTRWGRGDCPDLNFPIVALAGADLSRHRSYFFAIIYGQYGGRPTLTQLDSVRQMGGVNADEGFVWAPGTTFATVATVSPPPSVLGSRSR